MLAFGLYHKRSMGCSCTEFHFPILAKTGFTMTNSVEPWLDLSFIKIALKTSCHAHLVRSTVYIKTSNKLRTVYIIPIIFIGCLSLRTNGLPVGKELSELVQMWPTSGNSAKFVVCRWILKKFLYVK